MVRTIRSGDVIEKSQFYVGERKPRADRKKGSSSRAKLEQNKNAAVRQLARQMNCNNRKGDLMLTGEFDDAHLPSDKAGADKIAALAWRRLCRELKKEGVTLRGFWSTADKDAETGEAARLHVHAVISGEGVKVEWDEETGKLTSCRIGQRELADIWGQGGVHVTPLREQKDYSPLAVYIVRQAAERPDGKKWHPTRNLLKPVIESERVCAYPRVLRAPGGATVHEVGHYDELTGSHYIRYTRKPKTEKLGGHKERALWEPPESCEDVNKSQV
ncbi:MAG: hypothetical protein IJT18_08060 [Oscillospiraceae bacterium]|nr:hypothetical protein [Oscillospiraceae bacterium]